MDKYHVFQGRAVRAGLIARPGAPRRLVDVPLVTLLAFIEAEIRHNADEEVLDTLDALWRTNKPTTSITPAQRAQRMGALTAALAQ